MALGVRISGLDTQPKRAEYRIDRLQFIGKFFQLQQRLTRANNSSGQIGLVRKSSAPASMPFSRSSRAVRPVIITIGIRRVAGSSLSSRHNLITRLAGHNDVEQNQVGEHRAGFEIRHRRRSIPRSRDIRGCRAFRAAVRRSCDGHPPPGWIGSRRLVIISPIQSRTRKMGKGCQWRRRDAQASTGNSISRFYLKTGMPN